MFIQLTFIHSGSRYNLYQLKRRHGCDVICGGTCISGASSFFVETWRVSGDLKSDWSS